MLGVLLAIKVSDFILCLSNFQSEIPLKLGNFFFLIFLVYSFLNFVCLCGQEIEGELPQSANYLKVEGFFFTINTFIFAKHFFCVELREFAELFLWFHNLKSNKTRFCCVKMSFLTKGCEETHCRFQGRRRSIRLILEILKN